MTNETRYEVIRTIDGPHAVRPRRVLRAFDDFESARRFAVRRLDACNRHGLQMNYTGVVCDASDHYLFTIGVERIN